MRRILAVCFIIAGISSPSYSLDLSFSNSPDNPERFYVSVSGVIEIGDCEKVRTSIAKQNSSGQIISIAVLRSPGGNLLEGLCIGRLFRSLQLVTLAPTAADVGKKGLCASACALVWLSGVRRLGAAYAHHPYLVASDEPKFEDFESALESARAEVYRFIREMNLETRIGDLFLSTPSSSLAELDSRQLKIEYDPVVFEYLILECGPEMNDDEKAILSILKERSVAESNYDDPVYTFTYHLLEDKEALLSQCRTSAIRQLQSSVQIPK